jgi:hypothetical protein
MLELIQQGGMNMKRIIALLLAGIILLAACGADVAEPDDVGRDALGTPRTDETPETEEPQNDPESEITTTEPDEPEPEFEYRYVEWLGGIEIIKYIGESLDVIIPSEIENIPVLMIGERAFAEAGIETLFIPESITYFGIGAFDGNESIIITHGRWTYTYEDRYDFLSVWMHDAKPDPDMLSAWDIIDEWDVSELIIAIGQLFNHAYKTYHYVTIINYDGTVKEIEYILDDDEIGINKHRFANAIFNDMHDDTIPLMAHYNQIPDDIFESVKNLEPFALNISHGCNPGGLQTIYVIVGADSYRLAIHIGTRGGTDTFSDNKRVNDLFNRIAEWYGELMTWHWEQLYN